MGLLLLFLAMIFLIVNSFSIFAILTIISGRKVDPIYKQLIYIFPSIAFLIFGSWGGYLIIIEFLKNSGGPNIGLGIVIFWGIPFCVISFIFTLFAHYLISEQNFNKENNTDV